MRPPRAAYKRGAKFVDVAYFDPYLKRVRIESTDPDTLDFVPQWYGERVLEHAEQNGARISMRGVTAPHVMDGLDKSLLGKDMLPSVKETLKVVGERSTNWCFVPAPHPAWAALVHPDLPAHEAYQQLRRELEHALRLDEPDPLAAWDERMAVLRDYAARLTERRFDAIELRGPGTELTIGLARGSSADAARMPGADTDTQELMPRRLVPLPIKSNREVYAELRHQI